MFKTNIAQMINGMDIFWSLDKGDEAFQVSSKRLLKQTELAAKFFCLLFAVTGAVYLLTSYYLNDLLFVAWVPNYGFLTRRFIIYLEIAYFYPGYFTVMGFDLLYICITVNLIVQFDLLACIIRKIDVNSDNKYETLVNIIQYHNTLLQ